MLADAIFPPPIERSSIVSPQFNLRAYISPMNAAEIRRKFLEYFERQGHLRLPSSPVVPADDPTLLFTNAGMVQFKRVFLGQEKPRSPRATTAQKCLRAGGKHNDLEQVGHTARHLTFFEMLGNFSFGDYFKRDAIRFAWEFVTTELKIDPKHLRVSVFEEDDEARKLWREIAGLPDSRIYGLGAHDNFWQMADTGPCGPCTEIFVDIAHLAGDWKFPPGAKGEWTELDRAEFSKDAFVAGSEADRFIEIWNLVFMQFDRQEDGTLIPLPKPSVDTGAGLDRITAVLQGQASTFHSDLFKPLIATVEEVTGLRYDAKAIAPSEQKLKGGSSASDHSPMVKSGKVLADPASFRVIADHARAVAFLLADGVFPSNEGRGYVLRRILRRAVRHAWLLGRRSPTLDRIVAKVVETMGDAYPELTQRAKHLVDTTHAEEVRFLATIEGGMKRFEELAPEATTQGSSAIRGTISGDDAFKLYDTFGFPIDLTELMARERGYTVDIAGFEKSLEGQRSQSKAERKSKQIGIESETPTAIRTVEKIERMTTEFTGYATLESSARVLGIAEYPDDRVEIIIDKSPFYVQSGGQISDAGELVAPGWRYEVTGARNVDGRTYLSGKLTGSVPAVVKSIESKDQVVARVPRNRRLDTERNHTATHLLHAALREVLGDHVHQAGSLVAPDRLRFDFTHHGPVTAEQQAQIEDIVNRAILEAIPVRTDERPYAEAVAGGAMALFGEKYGDVVRVVSVSGVSQELCGGTHVRNTSEIALFKITGETGVAVGVRRIEAVTGRAAVDLARERDAELKRIESALKVPGNGALRRIQSLAEERRALEKRLEDVRRSGGGNRAREIVAGATALDGLRLVTAKVESVDLADLQSFGDEVRGELKSGVAFLFSNFGNGKNAMLAVVTDDLRDRGIRADEMIREVAAAAGGKGGGKPHMAQAGIPDESRVAAAFALAPEVVRRRLAGSK
jgi:alanyl-tRNA synthetase